MKRIGLPWVLVALSVLGLSCERNQDAIPMVNPVDPVDEIGIDMYMSFEDEKEPFQVLSDRPTDPSDASNGCLPGIPWNAYYLYNVCLAPTAEMSDFAIERSSTYFRKGSHSARFFLKATTLDRWPIGQATHRAELRPNPRAPFQRYPKEGEVRWYGMSVFFPNDFIPVPSSLRSELRFMIAQWQHGSEGSPIFALEVHGSHLAVSRSKGVSTDSQWIPPEFISEISQGRWMDLIAQVKWSKQSGFVKVWVDDVIRYEQEGIQTIYHNLDIGGGFKFGIYHWRWKDKVSVERSIQAGIDHREVFIDEVKEYIGEADGYELVAPGAE